MKTNSNGGYYVTFKSIFAFWDILEHDFKKIKFLLGMKTTLGLVYYKTCKSIFVFWDILEQDLKKGRNFFFIWKLYQAGVIT